LAWKQWKTPSGAVQFWKKLESTKSNNMGLLFRRRIHFGPIQANLSKGGIGWSVNLGVCRFGVNPYGKLYISAGIPGTGLYYIKYFKFRKDATNSDMVHECNEVTDKNLK